MKYNRVSFCSKSLGGMHDATELLSFYEVIVPIVHVSLTLDVVFVDDKLEQYM